MVGRQGHKVKKISLPSNPSFLPPPPANNNACNAIMVNVNGGIVTGDNLQASVQNNEVVPPAGTSCNTTDGWCEVPPSVDNSVWYKFVVPAGGAVLISTCGGLNSFDTQLALWDPVICSNFSTYTFIAANDDGTNCVPPLTSYLPVGGLTPGDTLLVQLDGNGGDAGTFDFEITSFTVPANDQPCNAITITVGAGPGSYTLTNALVDSNEKSIVPLTNDCSTGWCETQNTIDNSVWFTFTAPPSGGVTISTCNSLIPFDTQLALYETANCSDYNAYSLISANDDGDTNYCSTSAVSFTSFLTACGLTPGNTYYLLIDGYEGASGDFELEINSYTPLSPVSIITGTLAPTCPSGSNGTALIQTTGGTFPYHYLWSNGYIGNTLIAGAGTYIITVTDRCGLMDTATATIPAGTSSLDVYPGNTLHICDSLPVTLNASAVAGLQNDTAVSFFGYEVNNGNLIQFNTNTLSNPQIISGGLTETYFAGDLTPFGYFVIDDNPSELIQLETKSGTKSVLGIVNKLPGHTWTGMTWNTADSVLYALSSDGLGCTLYSIDLNSSSSTVISNLSGITIGTCLACSPGGTLFTIDIGSDSLYTINKTTGLAVALGSIGFDAYNIQSADFDNISGKFYLAAYNQTSGQSELRIADTLNGNSTFIGILSDEIDGLACFPYTSTGLYSYSWAPASGLSSTTIANPSANPLTTTIYTVTVTDACGTTSTGTQEVLISVITISISKTDVSVTGGNDGTATTAPAGGVLPYQFLWNNSATTSSISGLLAGTYTVTVTDSAGCSASDTITILESSGIHEFTLAGFSELMISPNPSSGKFILTAGLYEKSAVELTLYGIPGQVVETISIPASTRIKKNFDLQKFGKGVYFLRLKTKKGIVNQRLIVQ